MTLSLTIKLADCLSLLPIPNTSEVLWSLICDIVIIPWSHCRHYHYHAILDTQVFRAVQVWPSRQSRAWAGYPRIHVSVSSLSKQSCYDLLVHALLCQFDSEVSILAQQIKYFLFEPTEFSLNIALPCKEETSWQSRYNFNIFLDVRTRGDTHPRFPSVVTVAEEENRWRRAESGEWAAGDCLQSPVDTGAGDGRGNLYTTQSKNSPVLTQVLWQKPHQHVLSCNTLQGRSSC